MYRNSSQMRADVTLNISRVQPDYIYSFIPPANPLFLGCKLSSIKNVFDCAIRAQLSLGFLRPVAKPILIVWRHVWHAPWTSGKSALRIPSTTLIFDDPLHSRSVCPCWIGETHCQIRKSIRQALGLPYHESDKHNHNWKYLKRHIKQSNKVWVS